MTTTPFDQSAPHIAAFIANAMAGDATPNEIRAVYAHCSFCPDCNVPDEFPPEPDPESIVAEQQDIVNRVYTHILDTRSILVFEESIYILETTSGLWERLSDTMVADHTRNAMGVRIKRTAARDIAETFEVNINAFELIGDMDLRRLIPAGARMLDMDQAEDVSTNGCAENKTIRRRWMVPPLPTFQPNPVSIIVGHDADSGEPLYQDAWDYLRERYTDQFLEALSVLLFGRVRKEMTWAFSSVANYGKSTIVDVIAKALPRCIARLGTRALTEQGMRFSNIEVAATEHMLVVVDEADKSPVALGLLNNLGDAITVERKGLQSYQTKRAGNVLFLAGGAPDLDLHGQGVLARVGKMIEFPLETPMPQWVSNQLRSPEVGEYIVARLLWLAWRINHGSVFGDQITPVARELADDLRDPVAEAMEEITTTDFTGASLLYGGSDIVDILLEYFPDHVGGRTAKQLNLPVGKILTNKFGKPKRTSLNNGHRKMVYPGLLVNNEFSGGSPENQVSGDI